MEYELQLSDVVKKLMQKVLKEAGRMVQGFLYFRNRTIIKAHYDKEGCDKYLEDMTINQQNVLVYLRRKYKPTWTEDGAIFKDQSCIQKVTIKEDKTLFIHIANSEPHKIITDTVHVMSLLRDHGFDFTPDIKYYIETLKLAFQDVLLYNLCLAEFNLQVPSVAKVVERRLLAKYNMYEVIKIKKRSVKRKFLRYWLKKGEIDWQQLRNLLKMEAEDYTPIRIKTILRELRQESISKGYPVTFR